MTQISHRKSLGPGAAACRPSHRAHLPPPVWTRTAHCSWGPQGAGLGRRSSLWAVLGRLGGAVPGSEENLQGDGGWRCVDWSCLQQSTARGDPEGHRVLVPLLLACTKGKGKQTWAGSSMCCPRKSRPPSSAGSLRIGELAIPAGNPGGVSLQGWGTQAFLGVLTQLHREAVGWQESMTYPSAQSSSSGSHSGSSGRPPGPARGSQSRSQSPPSWWRAAAQARPRWPAGAPPKGHSL